MSDKVRLVLVLQKQQKDEKIIVIERDIKKIFEISKNKLKIKKPKYLYTTSFKLLSQEDITKIEQGTKLIVSDCEIIEKTSDSEKYSKLLIGDFTNINLDSKQTIKVLIDKSWLEDDAYFFNSLKA
jgi:hypothetical protein